MFLSIGEFVATGDILLLYFPRIGELHIIASLIRFYFRHPSRNSDKDNTAILPSLLFFCAYSRREMHPLPNKWTFPLLPNLSHMAMLLMLMSPLFNVHFRSALNIRSSFPETPTLLLAAHHLYSIELHDRRRAFASIFPFCSFKTDCGLIYKPTFIDLHSPPCLNTLRYFSSFAMPICY